jgi:cell pole-organizing protein PopZ
MTSTNGAHYYTVEDLLSSIRTSINDDTGPMRQGPSSPLMPIARREQGAPEEHAEFELPAIFKPGHQQSAEKPHNLFGRLSDALKQPAAAEQDRSRTVIRFEPAHGRMIEPPAPVVTAQAPRYEPPRYDPPAPEQSNQGPSEVKRQMPSFFDTRMNQMARKVSAPTPVDLPPPPAPVAAAPQPPPLRQPFAPVDNAQSAQQAGQGGAIEDVAAQLLRPILQQWLTDNMPRIVEKALRSEAGDEAPPQGGGRKPGR